MENVKDQGGESITQRKEKRRKEKKVQTAIAFNFLT
jgi:hypothetical protein